MPDGFTPCRSRGRAAAAGLMSRRDKTSGHSEQKEHRCRSRCYRGSLGEIHGFPLPRDSRWRCSRAIASTMVADLSPAPLSNAGSQFLAVCFSACRPYLRIPVIPCTGSDAWRPPVPIDRDQCDSAVSAGARSSRSSSFRRLASTDSGSIARCRMKGSKATSWMRARLRHPVGAGVRRLTGSTAKCWFARCWRTSGVNLGSVR